jgi:hypothetical protein
MGRQSVSLGSFVWGEIKPMFSSVRRRDTFISHKTMFIAATHNASSYKIDVAVFVDYEQECSDYASLRMMYCFMSINDVILG